MSKIWNGDVDMADGKLAETYAAYRKRLDFADGIGLPPRNRRHEIASDLQLLKASLSSDLDTVSTGKHQLKLLAVCMHACMSVLLYTLSFDQGYSRV